jgi:hypothetical protein
MEARASGWQVQDLGPTVKRNFESACALLSSKKYKGTVEQDESSRKAYFVNFHQAAIVTQLVGAVEGMANQLAVIKDELGCLQDEHRKLKRDRWGKGIKHGGVSSDLA